MPASMCAAPSFRACRSCSSAAARTSPGAPRPHRPTTSTSSSRRCAETTTTTCTADSASRCAASSSARSRSKGSARPGGLVRRDDARPRHGYAKVGGKRVAISLQRSTRGRELLSTKTFYDLNTGRVDSAKDFLSTMNGVEFSFNWFYADDRDIAHLLERSPPAARRRHRSGAADLGHRRLRLARLPPVRRPRAGVNPPSGTILNWNNRPAPNVGAADSNFAYGSMHRVDLLRAAVAARKKHTLATLTGAMNKAATQDLRVVRVWPIIKAVLQTGSAPSARAEAAASLLDNWRSERIEPARSRPRREAWTIPARR